MIVRVAAKDTESLRISASQEGWVGIAWSYCMLFFVATVMLFGGMWERSETAEWVCFVVGMSVACPAGLATAHFQFQSAAKDIRNFTFRKNSVLVFNFGSLAALGVSGHFLMDASPIRKLLFSGVFFLIVGVVNYLLFLKTTIVRQIPRVTRVWMDRKVAFIFAVVFVLTAAFFFSGLISEVQNWRRADVFLWLVTGFFLSLVILAANTNVVGKWVSLVSVFLLLLFAIQKQIYFDIHHYNFYLGPANAILHGRHILTDVFGQYGALIYFPVSFLIRGAQAMDWNPYVVMSATCILGHMAIYSMIFGILVMGFGSSSMALAVTMSVVIFNGFASAGYLGLYPSVGFWRFGIPLGVVFAKCLDETGEMRDDRRHYWIKAVLLILVGISSVWSLETAVYTWLTVLAMEAYRSFATGQTIKHQIRSFLLGICPALIFGAMAHLSFALICMFSLGGNFPDWLMYLRFVEAYTPSKEFGTLLVPLWGGWWLYMGIIVYSVSALFFNATTERSRSSGSKNMRCCDHNRNVVWSGVTGLCIATSTYYLGRSHPNNLLHILPFFFLLAGFCLQSVITDRTGYIRVGLIGFAIVCVSAGGIQYSESIRSKVPGSIGAWLFSGFFDGYFVSSQVGRNDLWGDDEVVEAVGLIRRYANDRTRVSVFLSTADRSTVTLLQARKADLYPIGHLDQDILVQKNIDRIVKYDIGPDLRGGNGFAVVANFFLKRGKATDSDLDGEPVIEGGGKVGTIVSEMCFRYRCKVAVRGELASLVEVSGR